ncbi:MAG: hypothetical protein WA987_16720 [Cellvibrio sp.]
MLIISDEIKITPRKIKAVLHDPAKSAKAIKLIYVQDSQPGISRRKEGEIFCYYLGKRKVRNKQVLERIKKLAIPPAWEDVWICHLENGHLQATGIDARRRKQYKYHSLWNSFRNHTKFYRLHAFGNAIPTIRRCVEKDLARSGMPVEKVLATVVYLMEQTSIRIGNTAYEKLYGSFGLTTLKNKHVKIHGDHMQFIFKGKKGTAHNISLKSKRLARIIKQCRDIPGKELFQYYDDEGNHKAIDSGMVNDYLKNITDQDFTAKDFRTWIGTVHALTAFKVLEPVNTKAEVKRNIISILDEVAAHLGNTRTVCRKYYVHPVIIGLYERGELLPYVDKFNTSNKRSEKLTKNEELLLYILEQEGLV